MDQTNAFSDLIRIFRQRFCGKTGIKEVDWPSEPVDSGQELLAQLPNSQWNPQPFLHQAGLFLGCPLSNDRRELTESTLFWCPQGWPNSRIVSLASSRLGDRLTNDPAISNAIRNFFVYLGNDDTVLTGSEATLDLPLTRGCQLFLRPHLRLVPIPSHVTAEWIESTLDSTLTPTPTRQRTIYFDSGVSSVDELIFALSDQIRIVHKRRAGNIDRLANKYRNDGPGPIVMTLITNSPTMSRQPANLKKECTNLKETWVGWYLYPSGTEFKDDAGTVPLRGPVDWSVLNAEFVSHWTRADRRPGPGQTCWNQFDELLLGSRPCQGPLGTLCRILAEQRLLGSGRLVQGRQRVVCFTEVPLSEFHNRRVFRPQLSRWDFEPFGVSIRRLALERLGGRPVNYVPTAKPVGDRSERSALDVVNPPQAKVDWSTEREWRVVGDFDLRKLGPEDAVVFVPDDASASVVTGLSRWPIVVLPGPKTGQ